MLTALQREKREAAEADMQRMIKAAILLQQFWRSYRVRKLTRAAAAKKDKKKDKKAKK